MIVRRVARPLLAAMFIDGGIDQLRHPQAKMALAGPFIAQISGPLHLPNDPELLVRANGAAMAGAGTLFALGRVPRLASLVMAATLVPTTYAGHQFWKEKDPVKRRQQRLHLLKNLGLIGGTLLAAVDTQGRPGVAWRSQHAAEDAKRAAARAKKDARRASRSVKREAKRAAHRATEALPHG